MLIQHKHFLNRKLNRKWLSMIGAMNKQTQSFCSSLFIVSTIIVNYCPYRLKIVMHTTTTTTAKTCQDKPCVFWTHQIMFGQYLVITTPLQNKISENHATMQQVLHKM